MYNNVLCQVNEFDLRKMVVRDDVILGSLVTCLTVSVVTMCHCNNYSVQLYRDELQASDIRVPAQTVNLIRNGINFY